MIYIPDEIVSNSDLSDAAKILWAIIKGYNQKGIKMITRYMLSKDTGKSKSTISRIIAELTRFNYLLVYNAGPGLDRVIEAKHSRQDQKTEPSAALKQFYKDVFGNE